MEDLELAAACARGDSTALARFEALFSPVMLATARRFGSSEFAKEVAQAVRERLLLAAPGRAARIADYSGQGPLAGYVQAVTVRLSLNRLASESRQPATGDEALFDQAAEGDDPELAAVKLRFRAEFKQAFAAAMAALEPELRAAVRLFYIDGLALADLGRLYGWSVPTASRRLAATRETLLRATREHLAARLGLSAAEVDSVLRLIESRLSVEKLTAG